MIRIYAGTDQGRVRPVNQDAYVYEVLSPKTAYAVVCDGMGSQQGGHIASSKAAELIGQALSRGLKPGLPASSLQRLLMSAVGTANAVVYDMAQKDGQLKGMGTTVVAAVLHEGVLAVAHAGDSRIYRLSEDGEKLSRLTRDHSVVQLLVDNGEITEKQAREHPKRNYITRALGIEPETEADYMEQPFQSGRLLICTDGLYNYAPPEEQTDLIFTCTGEQDVYLLIDEANKAGGADNITAVIIIKSADQEDQ